MRNSLLSIAGVLLLTSCAAEVPKMEKTRDQMTERERQETIAASGLPGASVVKKGLAIADAQNHQEAAIDSAADGSN
jgi:hypothetical protein